MNKSVRYILLGTEKNGLGGSWGAGATVEEARKNFKKVGGRKVEAGWRFTSDLPFAPPDRPAKNNESDCWVGRDGSVNWVRCAREELEIIPA